MALSMPGAGAVHHIKAPPRVSGLPTARPSFCRCPITTSCSPCRRRSALQISIAHRCCRGFLHRKLSDTDRVTEDLRTIRPSSETHHRLGVHLIMPGTPLSPISTMHVGSCSPGQRSIPVHGGEDTNAGRAQAEYPGIYTGRLLRTFHQWRQRARRRGTAKLGADPLERRSLI